MGYYCKHFIGVPCGNIVLPHPVSLSKVYRNWMHSDRYRREKAMKSKLAKFISALPHGRVGSKLNMKKCRQPECFSLHNIAYVVPLRYCSCSFVSRATNLFTIVDGKWVTFMKRICIIPLLPPPELESSRSIAVYHMRAFCGVSCTPHIFYLFCSIFGNKAEKNSVRG